MSHDISDLAVKTTEDLCERKSVLGAIVIIIGEDGNSGSALQCPGVPLDSLIALAVQAMGGLRADTIGDGEVTTETRSRDEQEG